MLLSTLAILVQNPFYLMKFVRIFDFLHRSCTNHIPERSFKPLLFRYVSRNLLLRHWLVATAGTNESALFSRERKFKILKQQKNQQQCGDGCFSTHRCESPRNFYETLDKMLKNVFEWSETRWNQNTLPRSRSGRRWRIAGANGNLHYRFKSTPKCEIDARCQKLWL